MGLKGLLCLFGDSLESYLGRIIMITDGHDISSSEFDSDGCESKRRVLVGMAIWQGCWMYRGVLAYEPAMLDEEVSWWFNCYGWARKYALLVRRWSIYTQAMAATNTYFIQTWILVSENILDSHRLRKQSSHCFPQDWSQHREYADWFIFTIARELIPHSTVVEITMWTQLSSALNECSWGYIQYICNGHATTLSRLCDDFLYLLLHQFLRQGCQPCDGVRGLGT